MRPPVIAQGLFSYQIGGSERVGADIAIGLQKRGYELVCFACYDSSGPIRDELIDAGIRCVDLNYEKYHGPLRRLTYAADVYGFLRRNRVDSLIVHHATALIIGGIAARLARVRRVMMVEHAIHQLRERPDYRRSAIKYCKLADVVVAIDSGIAEYFRHEMRVPTARVLYIPNGVTATTPDPTRRAEVRQMLGLAPGEFVFLFVGRLQPVKDVPTLLQAFGQLVAQRPNGMRLLLAGDGPERPALESLARELAIDGRVSFLGARRDVRDLLAAADAFVLTSVTEGQPMAIIEAMASHVPCVATAVGGIPALLADGAGLLAPPANPAQFAAQMAALVDSDKLRNALTDAAASRVARDHSLDAVLDAYLDALELPRKSGAPVNGTDR